ncbi:MAG: CotH kinase family protein, partial [Lachnospiraceae bacterium]|nr:CotH kinase family protein [Lachnospiraceae bacterium]
TPISGGNTEDRPMIAWIFDNEEYTELYHTIFAEFISEYFDNGYFENMFDSITEMIAPYVEKDPTKFCAYDEFEKGISTLKDFCMLRAESISGQLNGSIGSTDSTQDSSTLVDAGELQISDMGTMNHSMGGNRKPQNFDENTSNFNDKQQRIEMNGRFSNTNWSLLAVCVGVLAIGLVVTAVFTRRKTF